MNKKVTTIALVALFFMLRIKIGTFADTMALITEVGKGPETSAIKEMQTARVLNMRSGQSAKSSIVTSIPSGETVSLIADGDKWSFVEYNGVTGYVYKNFLIKAWNKEVKSSIFKRPESKELNSKLSEELQQYLWDRCSEQYSTYDDIKKYYIFLIGTIDFESEFNQRAVSKYGDYGLGQTNKKWVWPYAKKALGLKGDVSMLLDDPFASIDCTVWEMNKCVASAGAINEVAYHKYNKGENATGTDSTSHAMVKKWNKWISLFEE